MESFVNVIRRNFLYLVFRVMKTCGNCLFRPFFTNKTRWK